MANRHTNTLALILWCSLSLLPAQEPTPGIPAAETPAAVTLTQILTFPQLAVGGGIRVEINVANLGNETASGLLVLKNDDGEPLYVTIDGVKSSIFPFAMAPGGARKFGASSSELQVGYAVIQSSQTAQLVGSLIFTINDLYDICVPNSPASTRAYVVVDGDNSLEPAVGLESAVAILNPGDQLAILQLVLRNEDGLEVARGRLEVPPGHKVPRFLSGFLDRDRIPAKFTGTLHVSGDRPFHLLALRQRRTGTLATLPSGSGNFAERGSQILYLIDSGVDLRSRNFSAEELSSKTVFELTGISKAAKPQQVILRNTNTERSVTLLCHYINDRGEVYVTFMIVLGCGQSLMFDPFDFEIPGTPGLRTSNLIFGSGLDAVFGSQKPWTAAAFGSGRFLFSAMAVGLSLNGDDVPEILYPNEIAPINPACGVTPVNTGQRPGISPYNLHVCNAQPMAFDFLTARLSDPAQQACDVLQADGMWTGLTSWSRTMRVAVNASLSCTEPAPPLDPGKVFEAFATLNQRSARDPKWPTALVVYNGAKTLTLRSTLMPTTSE